MNDGRILSSARRIACIVGVAGLLILWAAGCRAAEPVSPRIAAIRQARKLVVATAITRPFEYHDERTNQLVGYDVDLAQVIAQQLGVRVEWKEMGFADLLSALQAGQADTVIAAMYITPQRAQTVDFSIPYLDTGLVLVVRSDETSIHSLDDLPGKVVGVKDEATGARYAAQLKARGVPITVRRYLETLDSLEELQNGHLDVVFNDRLNTLEYIKTHPGIKIVGDVIEPASLGIAVRKGDRDLLDVIDGVLRSLQSAHEPERLYSKWIGTPVPQ